MGPTVSTSPGGVPANMMIGPLYPCARNVTPSWMAAMPNPHGLMLASVAYNACAACIICNTQVTFGGREETTGGFERAM